MTNAHPADLDVSLPGQKGAGPISWVWLVPIVALVIALFIAWQSFSSRGPLIEVSFANTEGIKAGQTVLKYRDVEVGLVEEVRFSDDLSHVLVNVRMDKNIAPFIDQDAQFWIVRPQVSARGITGLETVLSGVHLEGSWDSEQGPGKTSFEGLENVPLVRADQQGLEILLRAPQGGRLESGAPILYKGVTVGYIDAPVLSDDGSSVTARAFIEAPHDKLVNTGTRFWGASGFSVNLGAGGLSLQVGSIASLLEGGLTFDTLQANGKPVTKGAPFDVFENEDDAKNTTSGDGTATGIPFTIAFEDSLSGLTVGANVEFRGLRVGTVESIGAVMNAQSATQEISLQANILLEPQRFGLEDDSSEDELLQYMRSAVADGLRARLASQGLLSTSLKIELVQVDDAPPAELVETADASPIIPATAPSVSDVAVSAKNVMTRIDDLPIEELLASVSTLLNNVNDVISSDGVRTAPEEIVGLIEDVRTMVTTLPVQGIADEAEQTIADIRGLIERIGQGEAVPSLLSALDQLDSIAQSVDVAAAKLPDLLDSIQTLSAKATELPFNELFDATNGLIDEASQVVGSAEIAALPEAVAGALADLRATLSDVQTVTGKVADSEALDSLIAALARTDAIAASLETSAQSVPALIDDISELAAKASALPLDELTASASSLLESADSLIGSEAAIALPASLNTALENLSATISDVRLITERLNDSAALASVIAALERTDSIAQSLDTSAAGLPDLVSQIEAVTAKANALPLDDLVTSASDLMATADTLVGSEDTAKIPAQLAFALEELGYSLEELREGGAVENANATLASASEAAKAIELAAASLPSLTADLEQLIARSEAVLGAYGERSEFNAQTLAAIRDLRNTARAVTSLAQTIERKPNSLLIGR